MARYADFKPKRDRSANKWCISIPPRISSTGKRQRKFFSDKTEATKYGERLASLERSNAQLIKKFSPEMVQEAIHYHELFQLHGLSGLKEGCEFALDRLEKEHKSIALEQLLSEFSDEHWDNWSPRHP